MAGAKSSEAREFYIKLCIKNNHSKRELERQIDTMIFERTILSNKRNKNLIEKNKRLGSLRDNYTLEFLNLPDEHRKKDLRRSIITNLKKFILEFGKDFSLVGEEYRLQVGNQDFYSSDCIVSISRPTASCISSGDNPIRSMFFAISICFFSIAVLTPVVQSDNAISLI